MKLGAGAHDAPVLAVHTSRAALALLYELGKQSDNFYAEMVFKSLGGEEGRPPRARRRVERRVHEVARPKWARSTRASSSRTARASSTRTASTAASVVQLLRAAWRDTSMREEYVAQLSIGGVDGTLRDRFHGREAAALGAREDRHARGRGALGGYVLAPNGKGPVAFSVLFNKVEGHAYGARAAADKLAELVADKLWGEAKTATR